MEQLIPDWAPNVHPMVVHFPIALLIVAALMDMVGLIRPKARIWRQLASILYVLGMLFTLGAWWSGRVAADTVDVIGIANSVLTEHADRATAAAWYFGLYGVLRAAVWTRRVPQSIWLLVVTVGIGGQVLLYQVSVKGAQLVYEHGVGVRKVRDQQDRLAEQAAELRHHMALDAGPVVSDDGSWEWIPQSMAGEVFEDSFTVHSGIAESRGAATNEGIPALGIEIMRSPLVATYGTAMSSVEFELELWGLPYEGTVRLVFNVQDSLNYGFMELAQDTLRLGTLSQGSATIMDAVPTEVRKAARLRVVSDRTHFRGYVDGDMVLHGHGSALPPGPVGLAVFGIGPVQIGGMRAVRLD